MSHPFRSHWTAALAVFVLLAIVHTWPLATSPGVLSRNDNGDAQLNEWIIAWVAHQLPRNPARLFDGNIFYPARDTLAFSEPLIVPALIAAPALWLGASPVLAMNLLSLAGFTLTALAAYAVIFAWTRDRAAALVAGCLFAFNTHTLTRLPHVQALHTYGLPLALLLTDRLLLQPRLKTAAALAACMTLLAYTSGYLMVFATVMIAVALAVRAIEWWPNGRRVAGAFAAATIVTALAVLPLAIPYQRVALEQGMVRPLSEVAYYSATPTGYLAAAGRVHFATWSGRFSANPVDAFFPGVVALLLSAAAIGSAIAGRARFNHARMRTLMLCAITVAGFVLSLGPATPVYGWLFAVFPPMQGLRAAARFGNLFLLGIALLAGLGLASLRQTIFTGGLRPARPPNALTRAAHRPRSVPAAHSRRSFASPRLAMLLATLALVLVNLEALRAPFEYRRFDGIPNVYRLLAQERGPVVLAETPFYPPHAVFENAEYVLNSTAHWRPLMNGYSGYIPASYHRVAWTFWYFPNESAIAAMREAGVTHITVHPRRFGHDADKTIELLSTRPDFELMGISAGSGVRLYRLR